MKTLITNRFLLLFVFLLTAVSGQGQEVYYPGSVVFPADATLEQKVEMAAKVVPTLQQLAWQQMELTAFLHFGIDTFTDREWGDGKEDPALFNPVELDARQWVRILHEAGFRMVILTAKHHDGFCLWPTATTRHSVASSPWREGTGDVVKEVRAACEEYGMKFGIYLSPWDRNAECYGDSHRYNRFFVSQLTELLTHYGEVHEVWFDGANGEGPNGKRQEYDWETFYDTIRRLQPQAVMAIMGDDVRWVGNERGLGRTTEWSATVLTPGIYSRSKTERNRLGIRENSPDLGSREVLKEAGEIFWYPSEVDVSIRPGWFYHAAEDKKVKSLDKLVDIYFQSVGYNSVLLLNVPPDRRGLIHEADALRLKEWADYLGRAFAHDRVVDSARYAVVQEHAVEEYALESKTRINILMLQEDITKGQRTEAFTVEAWVDGAWQEIGRGTTIGYKRLLRIPAVETDRIRVRIEQCRLPVNLCRVAVYYAKPPEQVVADESWNDIPRTDWRLLSDDPLTIDLGREVMLRAFTYAPYKAEAKPTTAVRYRLAVSEDGRQWREIPTMGEFANVINNPLPQTVDMNQIIRTRFIRLDATAASGDKAVITMQEIGVTVE